MNAFEKITYLMLETNSSCQLSCLSCNRDRLVQEGKRKEKKLTKDELLFILDKFKNCPIDTIKLEGLSEPMLHPSFHEMAKEVRSFFPKAFVIIATNLQYELEKSPLIKTLPYVDMVYLSIDGIEETYEVLRKGASWRKLLESLKSLYQLIPSEERKKKLYINFTLGEENFRELPQIYKLSEECGLAGVRINLAQNWSEDELNIRSFSQDLLDTIKKYQKDIKGVAGWEYKDCFWPFSGIVLDVYGNIRQCVINTTQAALGNILKDDIEIIYNESESYQKVRSALLRNEAPFSCRNCDYKYLSPFLMDIFGEKHKQNAPRKAPC